METGDLGRLKQDAIDKIIFHATPKQWLKTGGPWILERGEGALLVDADGREFLDALSGGVFVVLAGYGRAEIAEAMARQAQRLNYTSPFATTSVVTIELARKLAELTPGDLSASFFCSSGSEAVEAAIKLARQYHEASGEGRRYKVVSLRRAYHGSTLGALSATGWSPGFAPFRRAADPMVPAAGYANAMPPYCFRCELGLAYPSCDLACATTIEQAILGSDPELVSCVILEPIMATAGCIIPPPGYLAKVRQVCDRYGVLLISDEVVCGFGRTGRWFGVDHSEVVPDIMVVAKGLTSGYAPMAAAIARRDIAEKLPIFFDLHTFGGHPVSAAAALANIEIIEREDLVRNAADVGAHMLGVLEGLRAHPIVGDVRGIGLLMAIELMRDPGQREDFAPDAGVDNQVAAVAREMGLFVRPLGGTVLLGPPLIFTKAQAERAVDVLDTALTRVEANLGLGAARAAGADRPKAEVAR
ncbi:MAG TPA: aspartate aminotransferase family protein [Candidatus Limnocylindrales bacterium]|nr:aspartate aminotransferase family protein [Candidatus Limnocylindrales bacterium]